MKYWLMKSEPSVFGIDDLAAAPKRTSAWDGVRNYQVRNMLRDDFAIGDLAFFYHSSCEVPGIAGIVEITSRGYPDATAFDLKHANYDPASKPENPRWYVVDVRLQKKFPRVITLEELRAHEQGKLRDLLILRRGNRLSITPVDAAHWKFIAGMV